MTSTTTRTTNARQDGEAAAPRFFLGVDVGTGSARAGLFNAAGKLLATAKAEIEIHRAPGNIVEQSSEQIWDAVCLCVREAVAKSGIAPDAIAGIGFDATCSLVVRGPGGAALPVGDPAHPERDVIVWMDHRALDQAARINQRGHAVLDYVGRRISPEMQTPKLLWLKENREAIYEQAEAFFDLSDFLSWKATGSLARSVCTVTCKWTYLAHEKRWEPSYFRAIGLGDLADQGFARIGTDIVEPGTPLGDGLTHDAAERLGLRHGTAVGAGLIDAHAGGIGTVGAAGGSSDATRTLAYVFGTSSCTMTTTREPAFVPGVWGPYFSAMVPGAWLNEGGQSAAGAAIDHLVTMHRAYPEIVAEAKAAGKPVPVLLADRALAEAGEASAAVALAGTVHVVPEFLGNRAPFADPEARALVAGLGMERDTASLLALYVAGICGLGYGLRQIVETQAAHGAPVEEIAISGGAGQHELIRQLLADATGLPVRTVECEEPVLAGSAILGAVAAGAFATIEAAMPAMSRVSKTYTPAAGNVRALHERRYAAFLALQKAARDIRGNE